MALDKFYNIYGLDTSAFYFDDEIELSRKLDKAKRIKSRCNHSVQGVSWRLYKCGANKKYQGNRG